MLQAGGEARILERVRWAVDRKRAAATTDEPTGVPLIATPEDLDRFLWDYFAFRLPSVKVCPNHSTPRDAFHHAYFARTPVSVWKASRGLGGKSVTLAALALTEALTLRADVNVLGGSGAQSQRVLETMAAFWGQPTAPRHCLKEGAEPGAQKTAFRWGNKIAALMASQRSVRGPHPQRLRLDEVDEVKIPILNAALGQPMSAGGVASQVVLSSTHQYPDGTMTEVLERAAAHGWPVFEWCYRETMAPHGWLTLEEINRKREMMTALDWDTEVELQEPSSEDLAFDRPSVDAAIQAGLKLEGPKAGAHYAHGADWARKSAHRTCIASLERGSKLILRGWHSTHREPWPTMVGYFEAAVRRYRGPACHDGTGLGDVVAGYLGVEAESVIMVGRTRADLFSELIHAIEHGEILIPDVPETKILQKRLKLCRRADLTTEHPPDEIVALAMAYRASKKPEGGAGQIKEPETPTRGRSVLGGGFKRGRIWGR